MRTRLSLALTLALAPAWASANINIVFDYTYAGSFFGATQKSILEAAANVFESRVTDSLGAITSDGGNNFSTIFFNPSDVNTQVTLQNQSFAADVLRIYVGADNLGGSTLGVGGPGGFSASGSYDFLDTIDRGQTGVDTNTDFAPWGGALAFNGAYANWYFDSDVTTLESFSGKADFYSVALHEIGHLLGVGTAHSWVSLVNSTTHTFNGTYSGSQPLYTDDSHWKDGLHSTIDGAGSFEAAMDPTLSLGTRKEFTDLDWRALADIGWQVTGVNVAAVPEPQTWAMLLAGLAVVSLGVKRRRT